MAKKGIRLDDSIAHFNFVKSDFIHDGKIEKLTRQRLAEAMFPNLSRTSAAEKLSRLANNDSERLSKDEIKILCEKTGVDANFVFDVKPLNFK